VHAQADRLPALDQQHRPHARRGRVTPRASGVALRGFEALALPLTDAAAARDELAARFVGHGFAPILTLLDRRCKTFRR
jgi:hypothetical protein